MYKPNSLTVSEIQVETAKSYITITAIGKDKYSIVEGSRSSIEMTRDTLEAIYYGCNKLQSLQRYNNEPSEIDNE